MLALLLMGALTFFACRKENARETNESRINFASMKEAFFNTNYADVLSSKFNDSLNIEWMPFWNHAKIQSKNDSGTIYFVPLEASLYSEKSKLSYLVDEKNVNRMLIVKETGTGFDFKLATYVSPSSPGLASGEASRSSKNGSTEHKVFTDDFKGHISSISYAATTNGYERLADIKSSINTVSRTNSTVAPMDLTCYYNCTWGYYCTGRGFTVTYTVSKDGCVPPQTQLECSTSNFNWDYTWQNTYPQWELGHSEVKCTLGGPETIPTPDLNPSLFPPKGGTYVSSQHTPDLSPIPDVTDSYRYICPSNFTFVSITQNDLWLEASITNIYCNLAIEIPPVAKRVSIPVLNFGIPYYNVDGKLVFSKVDAANMAADALNWGEYRMRKKFKNNPYFTEAQLADIWISEANNMMTTISKGLGRVGRNASLNPAQPIVSKAYVPCN